MRPWNRPVTADESQTNLNRVGCSFPKANPLMMVMIVDLPRMESAFSLGESLPAVYWPPERPAATFGEVFYIDFGDKVRAYLDFMRSIQGASCPKQVLSSPSSAAAITDILDLSNLL